MANHPLVGLPRVALSWRSGPTDSSGQWAFFWAITDRTLSRSEVSIWPRSCCQCLTSVRHLVSPGVVPRRQAGRLVALATQQGKQRALSRPLLHGLGLTLCHADTLNTDRLGSFAGEEARPADARTTCRRKAEAAMEAMGLDLGIASEGSFGPHPMVPVLPIGQEWLTLVDPLDGFVISEPMLCSHTTCSSCSAADPEMGATWLETDLRAHGNPTRMATIRRLAFRLVQRVVATCAGLPCRVCDLATELVRLEEFGCVACSQRQLLPRRDRLTAADPAYCPDCNP